MSYAPLSLSPVEDGTSSDDFDEDAISILSNAAPHSGYTAYRPPPPSSPQPQPQQHTSERASISEKAASISSQALRLPTPPVHHPISWPSIFPSRTPSQTTRSPTPSLGFRAQVLGRDQAYEEPLPWAESTYFRSTSYSSAPEIQEYSSLVPNVTPSSKQYFRAPRHIRRPWNAGFTARFPYRGFGALALLCLMTGSCVAILFAAGDTSPEVWPASAQPPIYLSILELLMGLLTLCALGEGIRIEFWTRLIKGTTIGDVHDAYESRGLWEALGRLSRFRINRVGKATIGAAVSMARGPMFQRALVVNDGIYEVDVVFVAMGIVVSFSGVMAIMPLYYGHSELGRHVSLNPLEIARAFGAPLFDGIDGNVTASDIEVERGHLRIRYGAVERNRVEKILRVENTSRANVRIPRDREIFG